MAWRTDGRTNWTTPKMQQTYRHLLRFNGRVPCYNMGAAFQDVFCLFALKSWKPKTKKKRHKNYLRTWLSTSSTHTHTCTHTFLYIHLLRRQCSFLRQGIKWYCSVSNIWEQTYCFLYLEKKLIFTIKLYLLQVFRKCYSLYYYDIVLFDCHK